MSDKANELAQKIKADGVAHDGTFILDSSELAALIEPYLSGERRLATREDAERFIQRELSSAQWIDEKLMISFEKESLIHALVEKWEFAMESSGESKNERR